MLFNEFIKLDQVKKMREYALENKVPIIQDVALNFLVDEINKKSFKDIKFLEIGSAIGYSSFALESLLDINIIETIELDEDRYNIACFNTKTKSNILLYNANGLDFDVNDFVTPIFDIIFIDAVKSKNVQFVEKYKPLLKQDGLMIIDNVEGNGVIKKDFKDIKKNKRAIYHGLKRFWDYLEDEQTEFDYVYHEVGDGLLFLERKK